MDSSFRYAVFISGRGSNLLALIKAAEEGLVPAKPCLVISDQPGAAGLSLAESAGIETRIVERQAKTSSSEQFNLRLVRAVEPFQPELIVLAGFMRILHPAFISKFPKKIINIHPSLLPAFPGARAQEDALNAGVKLAGATVHFVEEEVDRGPILIQGAVPVLPGDSIVSLSDRILTVEHRILPFAVRLIAGGRVRIDRTESGDRAVVDGAPARFDVPLIVPEPELNAG